MLIPLQVPVLQVLYSPVQVHSTVIQFAVVQERFEGLKDAPKTHVKKKVYRIVVNFTVMQNKMEKWKAYMYCTGTGTYRYILL